MKKLAILIVVASMFAGCAVNTTTKARLKQNDVMKDKLMVYGAYKADIAGIVTWQSGGSCSKAAFKLFAREQKNMDKLVDIIMKETCTQEPGTLNQSCRCEYSGIGMKYRELDAKEAALWSAVSASVPENSSEESEQQQSVYSSGPANEAMIP